MSAVNYLDFENRFRGDRDSIMSQFSKYDYLVDLVLKDIKHPRILDIGSGRGEWLQKWNSKFRDCTGIEIDPEMIKICRDNGLNIVEGDAIECLKKFDDNSINLLSIFHLIEHIDYLKLNEILLECKRILSPNGVMIMETPSIDNILVSTNTFYLDPTHITHINAQNILFTLENVGFNFAKTYFINGGPLQNDSHLKITRLLNGVAQDLLIIATKDSSMTNKLINNQRLYERKLNLSITSLDAAVDYDLSLEAEIHKFRSYKTLLNQQASQIEHQNEQIKLLSSELKLVIKFIKLIKLFLRPFISFFRITRKIILYLANKIFIFLAKYKFIRFYLLRPEILKVINFSLRILSGGSTIITAEKIQQKFDTKTSLDKKSLQHNIKLIEHYNNSNKSKNFERILLNQTQQDKE